MRLAVPASSSGHAHRCAGALALDTAHNKCFRQTAALPFLLYSTLRSAALAISLLIKQQPQRSSSCTSNKHWQHQRSMGLGLHLCAYK